MNLLKLSQLKLNKIMVGLALVMGASVSHAVLANNWIITSNNNCKVYHPNPQSNTSATWSGQCKDGYVYGQGTLQWSKDNKPDGAYVGNYEQGKRNGQGAYTWADGREYVGDFKDDKKEGKGTYTWTDGQKYMGAWKDDERNGLAVQTIPRTKKTEPMMRFLMLHGKKIEQQKDFYIIRGVFVGGENTKSMTAQEYDQALKTQAEKERLEAEAKAKAVRAQREAEQRERDFIASFKACTPTGNKEYFGSCDLVGTDQFVGISLTKQHGKYTQMTCHNGRQATYDTMVTRLTKDFKGDKCWQALYLIPNSCELDDYYRGQCNEQKQPHGIGYHYKSPRFYTGTFINGRKEGIGTQTFTDTNNRYEGEWLAGYYHGTGTLTFADGREYVGEWKDDKKEGRGTFTWTDGQKYIGDWKDDKRNGQGTLTFADGREYVGEWKDDKKEGRGTFTWTDGQKYIGGWKTDDFHGFGVMSFPKNSTFGWYKERGYGSLKGNFYVVEGEWENDDFVASCKPNRQACDKGREVHRKKEAEIAQKQAEAESKRRRVEQAQEPTSFFIKFNCASACSAEILSLSTPNGTYSNLIGLKDMASVYRTQSSSFKGMYNFSVKLTLWDKTGSMICSGSFTKYDSEKNMEFLVHYYSCGISRMS